VHIAVRDTGVGIAQDRMPLLFRSFSQTDASTTRKYGGTGLGLAISKRLAEMMGGTMWAESEAGKGSTFHLTIPLEPVPDTPPPSLRGPHPPLAGKRVLVFSRSPATRASLALHARSWGMGVEQAPAAAEALRLLRESPLFDVALIDCSNPSIPSVLSIPPLPGTDTMDTDMDGLALASEVERNQKAKAKEKAKAASETDRRPALPMVLLISIKTNVEAIRAAGLAHVPRLTRPVKTALLYEALKKSITRSLSPVASSGALPLVDPQMALHLPLRILVAEDNIVNQKVALGILQRMGYRAGVASNGLEVLDVLQRQQFDLIFMDVQMPEMDGLEATRQIRSRLPRHQQPRIIAVTAHAMVEDREQCLAAGMDDYISKPIRMEELVEALYRMGKCPWNTLVS
jgi:CheY-like chemotaxis protein